MKEPNKMISTKDFIFIVDTAKATAVIAKKIREYSNTVTDTEIKALTNNVYNMLNNQFNTLMGVLQNG